MDNVSMIAAVGKNKELGKNNDLIWKIKEDLAFFREQTMGKPIIMGMNTFNSLPKLLPGRIHVVLTRSNPELDNQVIIVHSMEELLDFINNYQDEVMIIGGASLYKQMLDYSKKLVLTEIEAEDREADVYFPDFNEDDWQKEIIGKYDDNNPKYKHLVYTRR